MNDPVPGVKYRIQNADFPMYIELTDYGQRVRLRGKKDSDLQYWQFDVDPGGYHYIRSVASKDKRLSLSDFVYGGVISAVWLWYDSNTGTFNLTAYQGSYITLFVHASEDDPTLHASTWTAEQPLTGANWLLVPVASSPQICSNPLPPGNYRVRNYNGNSLLTMHHGYSIGQGVVSANVYVRSQHHESPYQRWTVTPQQSGQYIIQNAGNNSYLSCGNSTTPVGGESVVPSRTACLWDLRNIGGLAWSIRVPGLDISMGVPTDEMKDGDKMSLVPSNFTPCQIWSFESYFPFGQDEIYAKHEVPEGKYLLQNVVRHANWNNASIYINAVSTPWRISPGIDTTCKFELKYIDSSPNFTLTYVTNTTEPLVVADVGGYIGFGDTGTEFVLLERNQGDPGYVICRPDSGHPTKVVSGRIITGLSNNSVFSIENQVAGDTYQMWKLVPIY